MVLFTRGLSNPPHNARTYERIGRAEMLEYENREKLTAEMRTQYAKMKTTWREELKTWNTGSESRDGGIGMILNQPEFRGNVKLRSADQHAPTRLDPGLFADGATGPNGEGFDAKKREDMQAVIFEMRKAPKLARSEPFASMIEPADDSWWADDYIRQAAGTSWHYTST